MSADIEVVEVGAKNSLLPNLTISVENDDDDGALPEIEYEQDKEGEKTETTEVGDDNKADIKPCLNLFPRKKIYENTTMGGAAELGLSFEEAKVKRQERARRFASPLVELKEEKEDVSSEEVTNLAKRSIALIFKFNKKLSVDDSQRIRSEALYLTGVNTMSTEDIFGYFGKTNPRFIEWIDDNSCNVIWSENLLAAIAIEKVAQCSNQSRDKKVKLERDQPPVSFDDNLDLMDDDDTDAKMEVVASAKNGGEGVVTNQLSIEENDPPEDTPINPTRRCQEPFVKNKKEAFLEIRFATVADKKELFAAKKSKYYRDHGNPHYGGTKGLLTSTYRKRYQMKKAMSELKGMNVPTSKHYQREYYKTTDAKRRRKQSDDEEMEKSDIQKEDDKLLKLRAQDLNSDDTSSDNDDEDSYGTMVADQVSKKLKAARFMSGQQPGGLNITTQNNRLHARLGKRPHEDQSDLRRSSKGNMLDRLPKDLRSRLGSKRNSPNQLHSSHHREERYSRRTSSGDHQRRSKDTSSYSSPLKSSISTVKSTVQQPSREMTRYSPVPWSDNDEDDFEI